MFHMTVCCACVCMLVHSHACVCVFIYMHSINHVHVYDVHVTVLVLRRWHEVLPSYTLPCMCGTGLVSQPMWTGIIGCVTAHVACLLVVFLVGGYVDAHVLIIFTAPFPRIVLRAQWMHLWCTLMRRWIMSPQGCSQHMHSPREIGHRKASITRVWLLACEYLSLASEPHVNLYVTFESHSCTEVGQVSISWFLYWMSLLINEHIREYVCLVLVCMAREACQAAQYSWIPVSVVIHALW